MRPALILLSASLLGAQPAGLDGGRLDPAWFGPSVALSPAKAVGFQWLKPGLDLGARSLRRPVWERPAWVRGRPAVQDERLVLSLGPVLIRELERGLQKGLQGRLPSNAPQGDVALVARVADATGPLDDGLFPGGVAVAVDLKLVDGDTGEVLAAFHQRLEGANEDFLISGSVRWFEALGVALRPPASPGAATPRLLATPAVPAFDLEGTLRRLEALRRDEVLTEAEFQDLRKRAEGKRR